jgi:hypothetical protein
MPGLSKHIIQTVWVTLTVNDFSITYIGTHNTLDRINVLKSYFEVKQIEQCGLYFGITLQ